MSAFAIYSATLVSVNIGGIPFDTMLGPDEFLKIEKAEDDVTYEASADGGGTLNVTRNTEHTVTLTLKKTSPANAKLSAMHKAGRLTSQGILILPVAVVDRGSKGDLFVSDKAWIKRLPDETYGQKAGDVEWAIGAHNPERFLAGH